MATIQVYVTNLRDKFRLIARKFGTDPTTTDKQTRALHLAQLVLLAAVIKALTDKGTITDGDLLAALNSARDDTWPDEPLEPPPPPE
jgi:hypothetical protein